VDALKGRSDALPAGLFRYVWTYGGRHQLALVALSVGVFALSAVPLELQRRIVNDAFYSDNFQPILWLALIYAAVALAEGGIKLVLNVYRAWVSERAVRHLRRIALGATNGGEGVEQSMVLSEVEPVGGFVGAAVSEPMLQGGILLSVFGYMAYLEPRLAVFSLLIFSPQLIFVPLLQRAINRRVEARVLTMRAISQGIVRHAGAIHAVTHATQTRRVDHVFALHMEMFKLKFSMNFLMNLTHHVGVAAALALGGWYAIQGQIEIGTVVAFVSGLGKVNDPWGDVVNWYRDMTINRVKYRLVANAMGALSGSAQRQPCSSTS
jgi:ABC-type multidrug transport system fused ATPase/permease subunit